MKLTVSCAETLNTGYNFGHDTVFPHETTDVHVPMNNRYNHRNVHWTVTDVYAYVSGSSPSRRDDLARVFTHPAPSLEFSLHA